VEIKNGLDYDSLRLSRLQSDRQGATAELEPLCITKFITDPGRFDNAAIACVLSNPTNVRRLFSNWCGLLKIGVTI